MRRFDFDTEAVVRLAWRGVRPINIAAPVKYLRPEEGGVSHFRYGRDNALLTWMHLRLMLGFAAAPAVAAGRRLAGRRRSARPVDRQQLPLEADATAFVRGGNFACSSLACRFRPAREARRQ